MERIKLYDGKYEIILDENKPYVFKCLRHGESWRDLTGDGMVLALVQEIIELRTQLDIERGKQNEY